MKVIHRGTGAVLPYRTEGAWLELGGCLRLDLAAYELDEDNTILIYRDRRGCLLCAGGGESAYAAEIFIPARRFTSDRKAVYEGSRPVVVKTAVPFDISRCALTLWDLE